MPAHILIVDDHNDTCEVVKLAMNSIGFGCLTSNNRTDALLVIKEHHPSVILLDASMPEMPTENFVEAAKALQPNVSIVLCSGICDLAVEAHRLGLADYLQKPFDMDALTELLQRLLKQSV